MIIIARPTAMLNTAIRCMVDENVLAPGLLILLDINKDRFKAFFRFYAIFRTGFCCKSKMNL